MTSRTPCCPKCINHVRGCFRDNGVGETTRTAVIEVCADTACECHKELCHAAPVEEWATEFHRKYCTYISGAPGRWKLREDADVVSMEIFIGLLLSSHGEREYAAGFEEGQKHAFGVDRNRVFEEARHAVLEEIIAFIDERKAKGHENDTILSALTAELKVGKFFRTDTKDV